MLYSSKRGRGVLSAWSEGVGRCLYGGINPPLTTHDEPDEDSDSVDEQEEEEPFHSNSTCPDVLQVQLLAVIVILQGEGRWKTREPKYRQLDSWLESLIEREVNCSQSWICTQCTFLRRRASWRGNMHRGFLGEFLSSDFFLPALSEWWPTQSTSSLNFSKAWINFRKQRPSPPRWISSLSYLLQAHPRPHNCEIVAQTALFRSRRGCLSLLHVLVARDASLPDRNWGPSNTLPLAPLAGRDFMVRTFSQLIHVGGTVKCPPGELNCHQPNKSICDQDYHI